MGAGVSGSGRRFYGIAEVADAVGVDRQLVTVWRRRSSHGMPAPDEELASGPLWTADTIEQWIDDTRARLEAESSPRAGQGLTPELARRSARRLFRVAAVLLEETPRPDALARALRDFGDLASSLATAAAAVEGSKRSIGDVAALARMAEQVGHRLSKGQPVSSDAKDELLMACLQTAPHVAKLLTRAERE